MGFISGVDLQNSSNSLFISSKYSIDEVIDEVLNNVFYDEEIDPEKEVKEAALASYDYIKGLICGIKR
jgi:hypothetical protein